MIDYTVVKNSLTCCEDCKDDDNNSGRRLVKSKPQEQSQERNAIGQK